MLLSQDQGLVPGELLLAYKQIQVVSIQESLEFSNNGKHTKGLFLHPRWNFQDDLRLPLEDLPSRKHWLRIETIVVDTYRSFFQTKFQNVGIWDSHCGHCLTSYTLE